MSNTFQDRQAQIDALLQRTETDPIPIQKRLLGYARIGVERPEALTTNEIQQVCYALIVHFAQMGIQ